MYSIGVYSAVSENLNFLTAALGTSLLAVLGLAGCCRVQGLREGSAQFSRDSSRAGLWEPLASSEFGYRLD